jgi:hypothetical protein
MSLNKQRKVNAPLDSASALLEQTIVTGCGKETGCEMHCGSWQCSTNKSKHINEKM